MIVFQIERMALVSWGNKKPTGSAPVGLPSRLPRDETAIRSG
jgi:hypothetical protein